MLNDFGFNPVCLGYVTRNPTAIAVSGLLGGLVAMAAIGPIGGILAAYATVNDLKASRDRVAPRSKLKPSKPGVVEQGTPGFIAQMGLRRRNTLIIGVPGSGKGLTTAHLIREVRKRHPQIKIVGIDPKNSEKETGYWAQGYDRTFRFNLEQLGSAAGLVQFDRALTEFRQIPGEKLLVIDEGLSMMRALKSDPQQLRSFNDWLVFLSSMGDSEGVHLWMLSQTGNLKDLGLDSSVRACFDVLALMTAGNDALLQGLLRTDLMPKGAASNLDNVKGEIANSEVGRAYYFNRIGQWLPLPRLANYSHYDRDLRKWTGVSNNGW